VNSRKVLVQIGSANFETTTWDQLRVGDIVKVQKDEFFPADLVLLSSSYDDGICYVETMNLDGETNLKLKQGLEVTFDSLHEDADFVNFKATVNCEDPNPHLYSFVGNIEINEQTYPLSPQQVIRNYILDLGMFCHL
jgi:phospholipid-translocating ATPase